MRHLDEEEDSPILRMPINTTFVENHSARDVEELAALLRAQFTAALAPHVRRGLYWRRNRLRHVGQPAADYDAWRALNAAELARWAGWAERETP
jgi:hypothetical protein